MGELRREAVRISGVKISEKNLGFILTAGVADTMLSYGEKMEYFIDIS